ncbi:MAG: tetratricopeptide repeat protein [Candidatus Didemnitutus sp.]|nr:tetratricopeptide repeat protein [Candidatus Didemnitutus sp.]
MKIPREFARLLLPLTLGALLSGASVLRARETDACRSARARIDPAIAAPAEPTDGEARLAFLCERGVWLLRLEQWKLAEQDFFAVLQKSPRDATARAGLAWAGVKTGRVDAARTRLDELRNEFPDAFAVSAETADIRPAALARIAGHVFWRQQKGALVADDLAESPYDFGPFQLDALLEDATTAFENGQIETTEELLQSAVALGAAELPAVARLRAQLEAARVACARLEPGAPELAATRFLIETQVAQARQRRNEPESMAGRSARFAQLRTSAENLATTELARPTLAARRRLFATWLALRVGAEPASELTTFRAELERAAQLFASTPNEGDAASAVLAAENLARLRSVAPNWPLSTVSALPSAWPDGDLLNAVAEITGGAPLVPRDARLTRAIALWQAQLEPFSVDNALDTPADALRLGDHYRIGAALATFERLTVPETDAARREECTARIEQLIRMSNVCANYPTLEADQNAEAAPHRPLHAHFDDWLPPHLGAPKAAEAEPIFARLESRAWKLRQLLAEEKTLPGPLPWRQIARSFEADYATYVGAIQIHDRPFLLTLAQLRRKAGDLVGTLDLLPLLEQRNQLGYAIENLQLPTTNNDVFPAEVSAFVRSLRGASPAATAYADLTAWIEEVNRTRRAPPLPEIAAELRAVPAVGLQWTWAQIIPAWITDASEALRPAEANAKDSASFALVAPELRLRALAPLVEPLFDKGRNVWSFHSEDLDAAALKKLNADCTALMRRLLELKTESRWKNLKGADLLEFRLAFAAGDFDYAAKTEAGVNSERYLLRKAQSEAAASAGLEALFAGKFDVARAKLKEADALEVVRHPTDRSRDDSNEDGENVLFLRALLGYVDMDGHFVKGSEVLGFFEKALAAAKLPKHRENFRKFEEEIRWRAAYLDDRPKGRTEIARYLHAVIFEKAARNLAFERACYLDPEAVKGVIETAWIDLHEFKDQLTWRMPEPPEKKDKRFVVTDYVENPEYFGHHGKVLAAIARKDYEEVQRLGEVPKTLAVQREVVTSEDSFWGYYRTIYRSLKW